MSEELKACPFCKTEDGETLGRVARNLYIAIVSPDEEFVVCNGCGATGPPKESEAAAAAAWNRRPSPEAGWVSVATELPRSGADVMTWPFYTRGMYIEDTGAWWRSTGSDEDPMDTPSHWRWLPAGPEGE